MIKVDPPFDTPREASIRYLLQQVAYLESQLATVTESMRQSTTAVMGGLGFIQDGHIDYHPLHLKENLRHCLDRLTVYEGIAWQIGILHGAIGLLQEPAALAAEPPSFVDQL